MALVSTAEYNAYAGTSGQDTLIGILIALAQGAIEAYCDRAFDSATYTAETYDGSGTDSLQLRQWPVTDIDSVSIREGLSDATPVVQDDSTYLVNAQSGLLRRLSGMEGWADTSVFRINGVLALAAEATWPMGRENIVVTYTAGYATIPQNLKLACYRLVDHLRGVRGSDGNLISEGMDAYSYTRGVPDAQHWAMTGITREVAALLAPYVRGTP